MSGRATLEVRDDVPIPPAHKINQTSLTATLLGMRPGQSVVAPFAQDEISGRLQTARKRGLKLTYRKMPDGTIRVWVLVNPLVEGA